MKYKLKKDLPFAKAGEEVYLKPEDLLYKRIALFDRTTYPYCLIVNDKIDFWIEEIKPREFWVVRRYNIGIVTGFDSESSAVAYIKQTGNSLQYQITKVREVLE